jgi:cell division septation protein DedD
LIWEMSGRRWVGVVIVALLVIGLVAFARGRVHHRGQDVGALGDAPTPAIVTSETA